MTGTGLVNRFGANTSGKDFIVGDIHGAFSRLQVALDRIGFDPQRDRLFCVGDLVDRGPESELYTEWLAKPWFHSVRGNHEEMAIAYARGELKAESYIYNGGGWNACRWKDELEATAADFETLPIVIEIDTPKGVVGIVHADCPYKLWSDFTACMERDKGPHREKIQAYAQWSRTRFNAMSAEGVRGVRAVVVGHTVINMSMALGNVLYIETGGWKGVPGGVRDFTIVDAETLRPA